VATSNATEPARARRPAAAATRSGRESRL